MTENCYTCQHLPPCDECEACEQFREAIMDSKWYILSSKTTSSSDLLDDDYELNSAEYLRNCAHDFVRDKEPCLHNGRNPEDGPPMP